MLHSRRQRFGRGRSGGRQRRRLALETLEDRILLSLDLNQLFVDRAYADLLGRAPEPTAEQAWTSLLRTGVAPQSVAVLIEQSQEFWTKQVREAYESYLRREPEDTGFQAWVHGRQSVGSELALDAYFLGSPEYVQKAGGTAAGFVRALYQDVLNRQPEDAALSGWSGLIQGGASYTSVAAQVLGTFEASEVRIGHFYHQYLTRQGDETGLISWAFAVYGGLTLEEVRSQFLGSTEYYREPQRIQDNPVLRWNQVLLQTVARDATVPTLASRNMAIVQAAVADAINGIDGSPAYMVSMAPPAGASVEAAVAAAAHRALVTLYPGQEAQLDAEFVDALATISDGPAKTDGMALGQSVADAVYAQR